MFSYRCFIYFVLFVLVVFVGVPLGCGGGGGADEGVFVDAPVEGLSFETDTQSGVTDPDGRFSFSPGETVRFFLGDTVLGQAIAQGMLSPFDLVSGATPITQSRDIRAFIQNIGKGPVSPMEQVMNRAIFLQTLDEDGDTSNGIRIPEDVSNLLAGVALDFNKKTDRFLENVPFRQLLADGFAQGLWGGEKPIQSAARAMDNLYQALGLTLDVDRWTASTEDILTDLNPPSTNKRTFDAEGRLSREENDNDGNGTTDERTDYFYDSFDRVIKTEIDSNMDGSPDEITTLQYDSRGNQILKETVLNGALQSRNTMTYNELGFMIRSEMDSDGNGALDSVITFEYDAEGNLTRKEGDGAPFGSIDIIGTYQYDSRGNQIREEVDSNADGTPNAIVTFQYDANDNRTRMEFDTNADGSTDIIETFQYDAQNNLISLEGDTNADGNPDGILSIQYDELGNITHAAQDSNADGTPESNTTLQYDTRGNRTRIEVDTNNDGIVDQMTTFGEYEPGNWLSLALELR